MSAQLDKILKLTGFKQYKETAYGIQNGIYVNVIYSVLTASALVHFFIMRESGISTEEINLFHKENRKKYRAKLTNADGNVVTVLLNSEIKRIKPEDVAILLNEATAFLAEKGYRSGCTICGEESGEGYTLQGGLVRPMCAPCHERVAAASAEIRQERAASGSCPAGLLGAVLGAIIGIIPWVLVGMLGYIASVCGLIMAFLSYKGYLLMRGRRGPGMTWILIVVLVVFTYIAVLASEGIAGYQQLTNEGYSINLPEYTLLVLSLPFIPEGSAIWGSIALGWLFAGLGSFSLLRKAGKEAAGKDLELTRISSDVNPDLNA